MTWTYTWDVNNRLVAAVQSAGGSDLYEISYKYDVFGNRIEQTEDTDGDGGGASNVTTRFAWEGSTVLQDAWGNRTTPIGTENWNIWADLSSGNALQTRYVRGDEVDQLFARVKSNGDVAWYLTDRMGSVRQMLDATGSLENTITYDGFGNVIAETDAAFGDRWKWTGREYNDYTGLQYNRARYYSGESGRWVSEDPIGFNADDYNITRYSRSNTINSIDPSGLQGPGMYPQWYLDYSRKPPTPPNRPAPIPPGSYEVIVIVRTTPYRLFIIGGLYIDCFHSYVRVVGTASDGTTVNRKIGKDICGGDKGGHEGDNEEIKAKRVVKVVTNKKIDLPVIANINTCHWYAAEAWEHITGESMGWSGIFVWDGTAIINAIDRLNERGR